MSVTKHKSKVILLCLAVVLIISVGFIVLGSSSDELVGVFTNGKPEDYPTFLSVEFIEDRFILKINIPLDPNLEVAEHIADMVRLSENGVYFIGIMQRGTFTVNDGIYPNSIALLHSCGGVVYSTFSRTRNTITMGQSHLVAVR